MKMLSGILLVFLLFSSSFTQIHAQQRSRPLYEIPGKHRGAVTSIIIDSNEMIFSGGEDGFVTVWNRNEALERIQISPYGIVSMALRPDKSQLSILESDGFGTYRISAWDYNSRHNLFTLRFSDPVNSISYSAAGSFLIATMSGRSGAVFIHGDSGEIITAPMALSGSVMLGATGRSERNMITYLSSGHISYWDLESGNLLQQFNTLPSIRNPILLGNSRFIGGFDSMGLVVVDAVTGQTIARDMSIQNGTLFINDTGSTRFFCLTENNSISTVYQMDIDSSGRLVRINQRFLPANLSFTTGAALDMDNFILGTGNGELYLSSRQSTRRILNGTPLMISDIAASYSTIAFLTERNELAFIPLDYLSFRSTTTVLLERLTTPDGVTNALSSDPLNNSLSSFLLWQVGTSLGTPSFINSPGYSSINSRISLNLQNQRLPIRSAVIYEDRLLLLDTAGTVSILDIESTETIFSFTVNGSVDAAFINRELIILSRIASQTNSPFILINISTGETVPLNYPGMLGVRVYRGESGDVYGAVVNQNQGNVQTSIIGLNLSDPASSQNILFFRGEDSAFYMAESGGNLASSMGEGQAALYLMSDDVYNRTLIFMERSSGLPGKIIGVEDYFIILDREGMINWYDNQTGRLLASFRLNSDSWVLESFNGVDRNTIQGRISIY